MAPKHKKMQKIPPAIIGLCVVILLTVSFLAYAILRNRTANNTSSLVPEGSPAAALTKTVDTSSWLVYTNAETGLSLKYPSTVILNGETKGATKLVLNVNVDKLSSIPEDLPMNQGRDYALQEKERLANGVGDDLVKIGSLYGQVSTTLSQFEVCSVMFVKEVTFYPSNYRVTISLVAPKEKVMADMPGYFTEDKANCSSQRRWRENGQEQFEQALSYDQGSGMAQDWYDTFNGIVGTINLSIPNTPTTKTENKTPSTDKVYRNETYGFETTYPKEYRILTDADSLSGYPNGVALLYTGGQAYDVIIEIWDNKSDYEKNYEGRLSDLKVFENKGKFITFFNNTGSPNNQKIIDSVKML